MTFNLLFDLDDTLLDTNLDAFLLAYFKKLAGSMTSFVPPEKFISELLRSTQIMYASKSANATLEEVFNRNFYPALGVPRDEMSAALDHFYDEVFPTLESLTRPRPQAIELVEWAFSQGWNVSIATDPLFPRKAILHRLRWAGLAPEKFPFSLISDFHSFHFAKASVSYFPEFLAGIGWVDEPVLMVGDSMERDVIPSQKAGLPVYLLNSGKQEEQGNVLHGNFSDLRSLLEMSDHSNFKVSYGSPSALLAFLLATPAVFHGMARSSSTESWSVRPQPGEWSRLEILCHLRDVDAEVNAVRLDAILQEENTYITGQSTDQWVDERGYIREDPAGALRKFVEIREKMVKRLASLEPADWERRARHTILGPTTLRELVEIIVDHDRLHIQQAMGV